MLAKLGLNILPTTPGPDQVYPGFCTNELRLNGNSEPLQ